METIKLTENIFDNIAWRERCIGFKHDFQATIMYYLIHNENLSKEESYDIAYMLWNIYKEKDLIYLWQYIINSEVERKAIIFLCNEYFEEFKIQSEIEDLKEEFFNKNKKEK
jgi:hypothetical protein